MDVMEAITARRSIRKYGDRPVEEDKIQQILEAAMLAPSARNERPWHFVVVTDAAMRAELAKTSPYTHMAARAPLDMVICADMNEEKAPEMWVQDCAAATENMLLAITGLRLGAVWCGVHPVSERVEHIRKVLKLPANIIPFNLVCIGYPAEEPAAKGHFSADRVHKNGW